MEINNHTSQTLDERWELIRALVHRWHNASLHWKVNDFDSEIIAMEEKTAAPIPVGVRKWVQFIFAMVTTDQWLFRDCKEFIVLEGHDAFTLLVQGENDYYWAVKRTDLPLLDPPVHGYLQDYENPQRTFVYDRKISDTVSAFALKYILDFNYMFRSLGGYSTFYLDNAKALRQLRQELANEIQIEEYHLFEMPGVIAILNEGQLHVQYIISPSQLPSVLKHFSREKSSSNGEQG